MKITKAGQCTCHCTWLTELPKQDYEKADASTQILNRVLAVRRVNSVLSRDFLLAILKNIKAKSGQLLSWKSEAGSGDETHNLPV